MIRPRTALAVGLAAWTVPAAQWAAYRWFGGPHPMDPGARNGSLSLLDRLANRCVPDYPLDPPTRRTRR